MHVALFFAVISMIIFQIPFIRDTLITSDIHTVASNDSATISILARSNQKTFTQAHERYFS